MTGPQRQVAILAAWAAEPPSERQRALNEIDDAITDLDELITRAEAMKRELERSRSILTSTRGN